MTPDTSQRRGLTLLELLLVMLIFGIVVGGGVGFFASLDLGQRQAAGGVRTTLRAAREAALARRAPATVLLDQQRGSYWSEALRVVGTWHFEDRGMQGAFGLDGFQAEAEFIPDGWIGDALAFDARPGAYAEFPVYRDPAFDLTPGFALHLSVRRDADGGGVLLDHGDVIQVLVNARGIIRVRFTTIEVREGESVPGGAVLLDTEAGAVPVGRWVRIGITYDRRELAISVDGIPLARTRAEASLAPTEGALRLSDPKQPFPGAVDDLVIAAIEVGELQSLPESVRFAAGTPERVRFDPLGALDRRLHQDAVSVPLEFSNGTVQTVTVSMFGTVE